MMLAAGDNVLRTFKRCSKCLLTLLKPFARKLQNGYLKRQVFEVPGMLTLRGVGSQTNNLCKIQGTCCKGLPLYIFISFFGNILHQALLSSPSRDLRWHLSEDLLHLHVMPSQDSRPFFQSFRVRIRNMESALHLIMLS